MKISMAILVLQSSIVHVHTNSAICETNMVPKNVHSGDKKFHLKDARNNQYIIVESNTMLLRTVTSAEFEHSKQNEITWFTECNDFTPINKDNSNHFVICIAGAEDKRLFYDESFGIFMFLNQETRQTDQTPHTVMNMRLVPNVRTNSFEYASLYCNRELGHLQFESNFIGIGSTETLLSIEELNYKVF